MSVDRTAVVKLLKARGAKARRGHLRIPAGDLFWYVDVLADGAGPTPPLRLEVGCWTAALPPEPDGGAVDCPLLTDVRLGGDPVGATTALLDQVTAIGDLATLRGSLADLPGALVDRRLRDLL
ncbi:hypothetical protein KVF89_12235 [Nocardioides carbamazepini]|uniref:hypothetical protein n=1 Tax=Nocardioides carbamazepini TaxID=2854259 RepID=UPI002149DC4B|nr:hypothetical protein [Nocardioides carbamazepini]MCR1783306.1 hypothetical protein [Nocardioides carbamazepini]